MTSRQAYTLISVLVLHARVLRASTWSQGGAVFDAWMTERRIVVDDPNSDLYTIFIPDLAQIAKINPWLPNRDTQGTPSPIRILR